MTNKMNDSSRQKQKEIYPNQGNQNGTKGQSNERERKAIQQ